MELRVRREHEPAFGLGQLGTLVCSYWDSPAAPLLGAIEPHRLVDADAPTPKLLGCAGPVSRILRRLSMQSRRSLSRVWLSSVAYAQIHVYDFGGRAADGWPRVLPSAGRTGAKPIRPPRSEERRVGKECSSR